MEDYMKDYLDSTNVVIGNSSVDLDGLESVVRKKESNLGNFICDAWLD
jgi:2',3'-cyclic-nucleotide 2'-phosphodiesterase (5'-nucleotidase family)